jgi:catechol 2,3-dioxygenase-like lactoylglutathione lyase family enzyme
MAGFALGNTTFLLFQLGRTGEEVRVEGGSLPPHGPTEDVLPLLLSQDGAEMSKGQLRQHFCYAVQSPGDVEVWDQHLSGMGVNILARMNWERGGKSVYFEDPDGNVGEVGSRGIWAHY